MMRTMLRLAVVAAAMASVSCGYTLAGRGSFLPDTIRVVGIPNFTNKTPYFEVEQLLTQRVRTEFIGRGKYKVLPQENGVDAVLKAEINTVVLTPAGVNEDGQATRYAITIGLAVQFVQTSDNKVLWQNQNQVFREEYAISSGSPSVLDPAAFFGQPSNAVDRMAADFARSVVSAILEAF